MDLHSDSTTIVLCSTFNENVANNSGGVLYLAENSTATVLKDLFQQNQATTSGGAISASINSIVYITQNHFSNNTAELGAAIAATQDCSISFRILSIPFCAVDSPTVVNSNTQIYNNLAVNSGGGLYVSNSDIYFGTDISISNNQAYNYGGGVHAVHSSFTIGNTVQIDGNQGTFGGGLSLANTTIIQIL